MHTGRVHGKVREGSKQMRGGAQATTCGTAGASPGTDRERARRRQRSIASAATEVLYCVDEFYILVCGFES